MRMDNSFEEFSYKEEQRYGVVTLPRVMEIKTKINKQDLIERKGFCTMKEPISKGKRQPSEQEKIIATEATDNKLISKTYKQLMQLNTRKINDTIKNGPKN